MIQQPENNTFLIDEIDEIYDSIQDYPEYVILDIGLIVRDIYSYFGVQTEYVLDQIFRACKNSLTAPLELTQFSGRLYARLEGVDGMSKYEAMKASTAAEFNGFHILSYLRENRFYLRRQHLPYRFETLNRDFTVTVRRIPIYSWNPN